MIHFGGVHVIFGLALLLATILLTTVYVYLGYVLCSATRSLVLFYRARSDESNPSSELKTGTFTTLAGWRSLLWNQSVFLRVLLLTALILFSVHAIQRSKWMSDGNAHFKAKEYWITGQAIASLRYAMFRVLHPDNYVAVPFNELQKVVFKLGKAHLPSNDSEIAVWENNWFFFPYTRTLARPKGVSMNQASWKMVNLVERMWAALEVMATGEFKDNGMKLEYYKTFPNLADYYVTFDNFYVGKPRATAKKLMGIEKYRLRLLELKTWLIELRAGWEKDGYRIHEEKEYLVIEVTRSLTIFEILQNFIGYDIKTGRFSCESEVAREIIDYYEKFSSKRKEQNPFLNYYSQNKNQASLLYEFYINQMPNRLITYFLNEYCGHDYTDIRNLAFFKARPEVSNMPMSKAEVESFFKDYIRRYPKK